MSYIDKSGYYQEFLKMKIHPIHKLNGGVGATLCNDCGKMIWLGHTEDLYCEDCGIKIMEKVWREEDEDKDNDEYSDENEV